jgi:hypothetical protein
VPTNSRFLDSLKQLSQWIWSALIFAILGAITLGAGFGHGGQRLVPLNSAMQRSREIGLALSAYARDNAYVYPTGASSTEIFQKLLDGHYVSDPTLFFDPRLKIPGKIPATSNKLKSENVCWDVTVPLDPTSSDEVPIVFETGFRIEYKAGGRAVPLSAVFAAQSFGIAVHYMGNNSIFLKKDGMPDGVVANFISQSFDSKETDKKKYQQLTPDGPLP